MSVEQLLLSLTLTNNDETVTGDGNQTFLTDLSVGMFVKKDVGGEPVYYIASITDDNNFELTGKYQGSTETVDCVIHRSFSAAYNIPRPLAGDHGWGDMLGIMVDVIDDLLAAGGAWTTSFTMGEDQYIASDILKARDSEGLSLLDDGDNLGLTIADGGYVIVGTGAKAGSRIFEIRENSNYLSLGHDGSDALFSTDDGSFVFATAEALTNTKLNIKALTGMSSYLLMGETGGSDLTVLKSDLSTVLEILPDAEYPINIFENASSGETRQVNIKGYRTGDAKRALEIGVGVDAADTASFDGVSKYYFDGAIFSGIIAGSGKLDISHNGTAHDLTVDSTYGRTGLGGVVSPTAQLGIQTDGTVPQIAMQDSDGTAGNYTEITQSGNTLTVNSKTTAGNLGVILLQTEGQTALHIDENHYVGILKDPAVALDVNGSGAISVDLAVTGEVFCNSFLLSRASSSYDFDMILTNGRMRVSSSDADDTSKYLFLLEQHYSTEEEDLCALYGFAASDTVAQLSIGGGNPSHNAYTYVGIYAAEDSVSTNGTICASFTTKYATFPTLITIPLPIFGANGARGIGTNQFYAETEAVSAYDALAFNASGYLQKAQSSSLNRVPCVGFSKAGAGTYDPVDLIQFGYIQNSAWSLTPNERIYLSSVAGGITQTRPISGAVQVLGIAVSATVILVNINLEYEDLFS